MVRDREPPNLQMKKIHLNRTCARQQENDIENQHKARSGLKIKNDETNEISIYVLKTTQKFYSLQIF